MYKGARINWPGIGRIPRLAGGGEVPLTCFHKEDWPKGTNTEIKLFYTSSLLYARCHVAGVKGLHSLRRKPRFM